MALFDDLEWYDIPPTIETYYRERYMCDCSSKRCGLEKDSDRHGTLPAYQQDKCRCDDCKGARRDYDLSRKQLTLPEDDERHGTLNGYYNWNCRCDDCKGARLQQAQEKALGTLPEGDPRHGRVTTFTQLKCRCGDCKNAYNSWQREYRKRKALLSKKMSDDDIHMPMPGLVGKYYITPGIIDDRAQTAFNCGQCHALAIALAQHKDYKPVLLLHHDDRKTIPKYQKIWDDIQSEDHLEVPDNFAAKYWVHAMVLTPNNRYIDINGSHSIDDVLNDFGDDTAIVSTNIDQLNRLHLYRSGKAPKTEVAQSFVDPLLRSIKPQASRSIPELKKKSIKAGYSEESFDWLKAIGVRPKDICDAAQRGYDYLDYGNARKAGDSHDDYIQKNSSKWYLASPGGTCLNCGVPLSDRIDNYCGTCHGIMADSEEQAYMQVNPRHPEARPFDNFTNYTGNE